AVVVRGARYEPALPAARYLEETSRNYARGGRLPHRSHRIGTARPADDARRVGAGGGKAHRIGRIRRQACAERMGHGIEAGGVQRSIVLRAERGTARKIYKAGYVAGNGGGAARSESSSCPP